jgi:hypothetical protein
MKRANLRESPFCGGLYGAIMECGRLAKTSMRPRGRSSGAFHPFETRPNVLRKLDSIGELSFVDIYRQTAR